MQRHWCVRLALLSSHSPPSPASHLPLNQKGFTPLFNGTNFDGWHLNGGKFSVRRWGH
jgi:hypothetical protein